ncbi:hypothetical protein DFQ26_007932 [Actinomortierella ambigua]|nr:hypothetical protein DFQ26_007932 [Actinomortierella ambigua]
MFHEAFGLNDFDTDALEQALLESSAHGYLTDLHSRMLRTLTQNRQISADPALLFFHILLLFGASFDNWLVYLRREFVKRSPEQNPWGDMEDDEPIDYDDLSLETKVMILTNLCEWQLDDPERFRQSLKEDDELSYEWRVMPIGYDSNGRTYWLFDDNRLYRENPPPPPKASKKKAPASTPAKVSKPVPRQGTRRSTRAQKDLIEPENDVEPEFIPPPTTEGVDWEPLCVTRQEWEEFAAVFKRSKHPEEKALYTVVNYDILPKVLEDLMTKERERQKLEAVANRKRSSRIVIRELEIQEKARLEAIRQQELAEAAERRKRELRERREDRERLQQDHLREQRLKEREERLKARETVVRQQHERKLQQHLKEAKAREDRINRRLNGSGIKEGSEGSSTREPSQDVEEEESWVFDCVCGVFGTNLDDGELMIACNKCNVWQHVACLKQDYAEQGKKQVDWEKVDFICQRCQKKAEERKRRREQKKLNGSASATDSRDSSMEIRTPQANGMDVEMKPVTPQPIQPSIHSLPSAAPFKYQQHHIPIVPTSHSTDATKAAQHSLPLAMPVQPIQPFPPQHMSYQANQAYQPVHRRTLHTMLTERRPPLIIITTSISRQSMAHRLGMPHQVVSRWLMLLHILAIINQPLILGIPSRIRTCGSPASTDIRQHKSRHKAISLHIQPPIPRPNMLLMVMVFKSHNQRPLYQCNDRAA